MSAYTEVTGYQPDLQKMTKGHPGQESAGIALQALLRPSVDSYFGDETERCLNDFKTDERTLRRQHRRPGHVGGAERATSMGRQFPRIAVRQRFPVEVDDPEHRVRDDPGIRRRRASAGPSSAPTSRTFRWTGTSDRRRISRRRPRSRSRSTCSRSSRTTASTPPWFRSGMSMKTLDYDIVNRQVVV